MTPGLSGLGKNRGWRKLSVSVWVGQDNCSRVVMMSYYPAHTTATQPGYPAPSPGSGLPLQAEVLSVRQLTRSRQLRSVCLVLVLAGLGRIVNSLNEYSISPRHLHKSHVTNSKQFCLNCSIKVTLRVPQLVSSPQFCDINLNIHSGSGYISAQYGDGAWSTGSHVHCAL